MIATKEMIEDWRKWYLKEGHTVHSTTTYYNYIKLYVGESIEINQKTVDNFREAHYNTASSGALKKFFFFLVVKKQAPREILGLYFGKNRSTKKMPETIEPVEVLKIINSMPTLKTKYLTIFVYEMALRISEALKVRYEDFNWSTWLLDRQDYGKVKIKHTKRDKFREIPVRSEIMEMIYSTSKSKTSEGIPIGNLVFDFGIMEYLTNKEKTNPENQFDYIVYAYTYYKNILYRVSKEVLNRRIHIHQLRHTKSQFLLDNGLSLEGLKKMLGHEKISTTEIYAQSSSAKLLKELKDVDAIKNSQTFVPKINNEA